MAVIEYSQNLHVQHGLGYCIPLKNIGICEWAGPRSDTIEILPEEGVQNQVEQSVRGEWGGFRLY